VLVDVSINQKNNIITLNAIFADMQLVTKIIFDEKLSSF